MKMNNCNPKILIVAGDRSGDCHAAVLAATIKKMCPAAQIAALGGSALKTAGANILSDLSKESVTGFSEVLKHIPGIVKNFSIALSAAKRADLVVLVDYPGFNIKLAKSINKLNPRPKLLYYIAPQVWAWHKSRIGILSKIIDKIAVVFPFEENIFHNAEFVGHPLIELEVPEADFELKKDNVVALLPGSRRNEIIKHLPLMEKVGTALAKKKWRPIISVADSKLIDLFKDTNLELYTGSARKLLVSSRRAIVKSGTSTLETALLGIPFVSFYKLSWFSYFIGKMLVQTRRFSMPNILLNEDIVPELIQSSANVERILAEFDKLSENTAKEMSIRLRKILGSAGSSKRTAELCLGLLGISTC